MVFSPTISKFIEDSMGLTMISCKIFNKNETQPITRIISSWIPSIMSWWKEENKDERRVLTRACEETMIEYNVVWNKGHTPTKQVDIEEGWEEPVKNCDGAKRYTKPKL